MWQNPISIHLHSQGKTGERVGRKEMGRERGMTEKVGYSMLLWVAVDEALNLTKLAEINMYRGFHTG